MKRNLFGAVVEIPIKGRYHYVQATSYVSREGYLTRLLNLYHINETPITCTDIESSKSLAVFFFPLKRALSLGAYKVVTICDPREEWIKDPEFMSDSNIQRSFMDPNQTDSGPVDWRGSLEWSLSGHLPRRRTITDTFLEEIIERLFIQSPDLFFQIVKSVP